MDTVSHRRLVQPTLPTISWSRPTCASSPPLGGLSKAPWFPGPPPLAPPVSRSAVIRPDPYPVTTG